MMKEVVVEKFPKKFRNCACIVVDDVKYVNSNFKGDANKCVVHEIELNLDIR